MTDPVHVAVRLGYLEQLKQYGDVSNVLDENQATVIHTAATFGQYRVLEFLLETYPQIIFHCDRNGENALHRAVKERQLPAVVQLVRAAAFLIDVAANDFQTPLQTAIRLGFEAAIVAILSQKPSSIHQKLETTTLLHLAVTSEKLSGLSSILAFCPAFMFCAQDGRSGDDTPLIIAVETESIEMVKLLVNANIEALDIADCNGDTPAFCAVNTSNETILSCLLQMCPHIIRQKNADGHNLLHKASTKGIAKILLKVQPTLIDDICPESGDCVLHCAMFAEDDELYPFLVKKKRSLLLHLNKNNETPLHMASIMGNFDNVNHILKYDPNLVDTNVETGYTVLHLAVVAGDQAVIANVFSNCMKNLQCKTKQQQKTPFCLAIETQNQFAVRLFAPHLTLDMAVTARDVCRVQCDIDLQPRYLQSCSDLNVYLLPELALMVLQFVGHTDFKKRKRDES